MGYDNRNQKKSQSMHSVLAVSFPLTDNAEAQRQVPTQIICLHEMSAHGENQKFGSRPQSRVPCSFAGSGMWDRNDVCARQDLCRACFRPISLSERLGHRVRKGAYSRLNEQPVASPPSPQERRMTWAMSHIVSCSYD
jgi:hypothetical protein